MTDSERVVVPGGRDVRATLDAPDADACVVACPPHPEMGGRRSDTRLAAVAEALAAPRSDGRASGESDDPRAAPPVATLRFDYGPWDEGRGELTDARNALDWARERYDRAGLFGYSFGGCLALLAAARESAERTPPAAVAALAPAARLGPDLDAAAELDAVACPGCVLYGERDTTVAWEPVVKRARALEWRVESMPADHHFVGQAAKVGEKCSGFLRAALAPDY
jgi:hypothetical protein